MRKPLIGAIAVLLQVVAFLVRSAAAQCTPTWLPGQGMLGINDTINAAITFDDGTGPALYVGGQFTVAGDVRANSMARWGGAQWQNLGAGMDGPVYAIASFNSDI